MSGALTCTGGPDDPRLIAALEECLAGIEKGTAPDRALLRVRYPDFADDLFACLDALEFVQRAAPHDTGTVGSSPGGPEDSGRIGDYCLVRQVGRGGMGVVYEAEQVATGRRVALKVLPFASALEASQLQRFQNEARVGAILRHPNIVPVYATGCDRGIYYYAMKFVNGPSLAALVDARRSGEFPGKPRGSDRTPGVDALPTGCSGEATKGSSERVLADRSFREVARLGREAAEALEAAHQAGVIHRDVKPSNLLLDESNNLWVADFGLARFGSERGLTRTGNLLGTLRYMSPEQALGRPGLVDHRTDLYSLGATLYELITLRPAFPGSDRQDLLRRIDREEPPRPRSIDPTIPASLEAVVLKAMAKHPADRYSCALELAADLSRFIGGQPVGARLPSRLKQCRRWAVRHPATVFLAAVVSTVLLSVVSVAAILVNQQRSLAEIRGRQARRAVDEMYTQVAEGWLARQPHLELMQREFLEKARAFYEEFARDSGDDPSSRQEMVRALRRIGDIDRRLGAGGRAESAYDEAERRLAVLRDGRPDDPDLREEHALILVGRGSLLLAAGRLDRSERDYRSALEIYRSLSTEKGIHRYLIGRAGCEVNLGAVLAAAGRTAEAAGAYKIALSSWENLCRSSTRNADTLHGLAGCLTDLGNLTAAHRPGEAEALLRRAVLIEDSLLSSDPGRPAYRRSRASSGGSLAAVLVATERPGEARSTALKTLTLREHLAADFPHTPNYREEVAASRLLLGDIQSVAGRPEDAASWYRAAAASCARLANTFPSSLEYRRSGAEARTRLAGLQLADGRPETAVEHYRAALSLLNDGAGESHAGRQDTATALGGLGNALAVAGRPAEGAEALKAAVAMWEALAGSERADDSDRWGLAASRVRFAPYLDAAGKTDLAEAAYAQALTVLRPLAENNPGLSGYALSFASAAAERSGFLLASGRTGEARADADSALTLAEALESKHADLVEYRRLLASCQLAAARLPRPPAETEALLRRSLSLARGLAGRASRTFADEVNVASALAGLAELSQRGGATSRAELLWREVLRQRERLASEYPEVPSLRFELAWLLANCPAGSIRDAPRALSEARKGVARAPQDPTGRLTLGAAEMRLGHWSEASDTLTQYCRDRGGVESPAGFLLAMVHARRGERSAAAAEYARAEAWRKCNRPEDYGLEQLGSEAADLLAKTSGR